MNGEIGIDTHILLCIKYRTCCTAHGEKRRYNLFARHITGEGNGFSLQYSCLENLTGKEPGGYSPWGRKELDMFVGHTVSEP